MEDLANYLANLTILLEYYEKLGATRNRWVIAEFEAANAKFLEALKEKHDETRQSESRRLGRDEGRAELQSGQPRWSGSARPEGGAGESGGAAVRRPGARSPDAERDDA